MFSLVNNLSNGENLTTNLNNLDETRPSFNENNENIVKLVNTQSNQGYEIILGEKNTDEKEKSNIYSPENIN